MFYLSKLLPFKTQFHSVIALWSIARNKRIKMYFVVMCCVLLKVLLACCARLKSILKGRCARTGSKFYSTQAGAKKPLNGRL